ncbi:formimidoylglutamase [Pedobacter rhizosphaerae]|uniref:Arginase family enzyme n=1 Tax=Pedobacter rhizosphaerae TaxID=390241 RepID=A0A1H9LPU6_9SPHI|nr:formimidoylglutamase [Pedobacter rhizosphaerae]SER13269.1 Arginase family enzyme [Pedobacter rhizosphaerae]
MSLTDFFSPINPESFTPKRGFLTSQLGMRAQIFTESFPDLEEETFDLAIFGVLDGRSAVNNEGCALGPDYFREKFYKLNEGAFSCRIVDLGNIKHGATIADTYIAVKMAVAELVKRDIIPIIIGGGQDLTYAQYMGYEDLEQKVDLVIVDNQFDIDDDNEDGIATRSDCYLNKIFLHQPNYLFNFSNIGYQTYFVNQESLSVMDKLYFDVHRLGEFAQDITLTEPIIRNANMISFDMGAIRSADAAGNANTTPNGFDGEEACRLARYAGMNDKLSSIGFYEFNPAYDSNGQTAFLLAQMVWYFVDGFYARKKDFPLSPKSQFIIYRTSLKDGSGEMTFVKSKKSDRWWMQVPYPSGQSKNERYHLVPCRYDDYQTAVNGDMPDLWWRTYQKLS